MAESAKKVAEQTEERLEQVAENVRERFDRVTHGKFRDKIREGRFADSADHGIDEGRRESSDRQAR
ncbi:hypothetical protein QTQ03_19050 [Micromonospora sp. WMMA1363]|uniref:hypothetical protein n=1 Tax=Micromonospora sp. WMMA1363 TaxID=3053985 RepID=UPI00259CBEF1|nr:hypothetical protein [Micromonospora sp. WMMA1363]MDM4721585.1 hypothetical protein [Micromonospora sp. WMMA1363]